MPTGSEAAQRRGLAAELAAVPPSPRTEIGTSACISRPARVDAAVAQVASQRAGHDRQHRVVDRPAERVLDRAAAGSSASTQV